MGRQHADIERDLVNLKIDSYIIKIESKLSHTLQSVELKSVYRVGIYCHV